MTHFVVTALSTACATVFPVVRGCDSFIELRGTEDNKLSKSVIVACVSILSNMPNDLESIPGTSGSDP